MIQIKGKYNEAKIFTDIVDSTSIAQVQELCNQEFTAGSRIRLMPDIHAGAGCTIGTTMTIADKVVPNLVGVDIGCGMETTRIREDHIELQKLDKLIYEKIPSGFSIRDKAHRYLSQIDLGELYCIQHVDRLRAEKSIGTLGGGNHFIEVDKDDAGNLYLVVHSGSRHLGVEVASYYQEAGYKILNRTDDASIEALIAQMKAEGRGKEIQKELKKRKNLKQTNIPKALAYVSGELFDQYIHDMKDRPTVRHAQPTGYGGRDCKRHEAPCGGTIHHHPQLHRHREHDSAERGCFRQSGRTAANPYQHAGREPPLRGKGERGLELLGPPRCRTAHEPGDGQAVFYRVCIQKTDGRDLYHLGE